MGKTNHGSMPPKDPHEAIMFFGRQVEELNKSVNQIGADTALKLAKDPTFLEGLAKLLVKSEVINTIIARELNMENRETAHGSEDVSLSEAMQAPRNTAETVEDAVPAVVDAPRTDPHYTLEFAAEGEMAGYAAARYDAAHPLFPNMIVLYILLQQNPSLKTFWQIEPNAPALFIDTIANYLSAYPTNIVKRFNAFQHNMDPAPVQETAES